MELTSLSHIGSMIAVGFLVACTTQPAVMTVTSEDFPESGIIPVAYTCEGQNLRPSLHISGVPSAAKSLAVMVEDADSASGTFVHWAAWDIDPQTDIVDSGALVGATEGLNDTGKPGYMGPCPQVGRHRYTFRVFAMDEKLNLPESTYPDTLRTRLSDGVLAQAEYVGLYEKTGSGSSSSSDAATGATLTLPGSSIIE